MLTINAIPAFNDNYIWCLSNSEDRKALAINKFFFDEIIIIISVKNFTYFKNPTIITSRVDILIYNFNMFLP